MKATRVGIIGIGQSEFKARRDDANYPELVREGVALALADAKRELDDMEAVVYSLAPDALLGIGNAERLGIDAVGARNKRFMRVNTGGSTGLSSVAVGHAHIAAGACDIVLVAGGDKVGESGDSQTILNKIWDPTYERQLPLGTITMLAMSGVRAMHKYGMTEEDMARVTVKNRSHAARNPKAHLRKEVTIEDVMTSRYISWPIKLLDACPQSSGGCAMVLASERYITREQARCGVDHWNRPLLRELLHRRPDGQRVHCRSRRRARARTFFRTFVSHGGHQESCERSTRRGTVRPVLQHRVSRDRGPGARRSGRIDGDASRGSVLHRLKNGGEPIGRNVVH